MARSLAISRLSHLQSHVDLAPSLLQQLVPQCQCRCSMSSKLQLTDGEKALINKLKAKFPGCKSVEVSDISGGCGAMYQISIEAEEFRGKKTVDQHRLVNKALSEEIKDMHGLQLNTKVPDS